MQKGITNYLLYFILGIIIVTVSFFVIRRAFEDAWTKVMESLGIFKPTEIENAIICSYDRCKYGLSETTDYRCKSFFDKTAYLPAELEQFISSDYNICNDLSFASPVVVDISKSNEIRKSMLENYLKGFRCIFYDKTKIDKTISWKDFFPPTTAYRSIKGLVDLAGEHSFVFLNLTTASFNEYAEQNCKITEKVEAKKALDDVVLSSGKYYVVTLKDGDKYTVLIQKKNPFIKQMSYGSSFSDKMQTSINRNGKLGVMYIIDVGDANRYLLYFKSAGSNSVDVYFDKIDNNKNNGVSMIIYKGTTSYFNTDNGRISVYADIKTYSHCSGVTGLCTESYDVSIKVTYLH